MAEIDRPRFTWLGHATVRCDLPGGGVMVIDPWVAGNPACPADHKELPRLDAMLITHAHGDHLGDAVELGLKHKPRAVISSYEICTWLEGKGVVNTIGMNVGGTVEGLGVKVSMVRADHSSSFPGNAYGGIASGFVVRLPGGFTFYHAGDTGLFMDMQLIGELYHPELAFLPIDGFYTMEPRLAAHACRLLGVHEVVPIHWGTFPALRGKPEDLTRELAALGYACEVIALSPGGSM